MKYLNLTLLLVTALITGCTCTKNQSQPETLYQYSTIQNLINSQFDGALTLKEVKELGDTGIGTFNGLDGEMVVLHGQIYQVKADGKVYRPADCNATPFACVTTFDSDMVLDLPAGKNFAEIKSFIDSKLKHLDYPYTFYVSGDFEFVKTRSVPAQHKPYPKLTEVVKHQPVFMIPETTGEMVGFRLPETLKGVNVQGFHLHYLNDSKDKGGHILDFKVKSAKLHIDLTPKINLTIPGEKYLEQVDKSKVSENDIHAVESQ